uniref:Homeobox domain-containing protein n=1 Tax=Glossina brevipalpis TaxID=37001 RepID=A0A1A9W9E9_9MUSC
MTTIKTTKSTFTIEHILGNHLNSDNGDANSIIDQCSSAGLKDLKDFVNFNTNFNNNEAELQSKQQQMINNHGNSLHFNEIYKPCATLIQHYMNADLPTNFSYLRPQFPNNVLMSTETIADLTASSLYWKSHSPELITCEGGQIRFSLEQTKQLEYYFGGAKYLTPEERRRLAMQLKLSDRQVKTWFQNRRAKWRRFNQLKCSYSSIPSDELMTYRVKIVSSRNLQNKSDNNKY